MELNEALELLNKFGKEKKVQQGALNLVETLVKNNVTVNGAKQFCAEHFMSENIAQYYEDFFNYVSLLKQAQDTVKPQLEPSAQMTTVDGINILKSIDNTLKEILECLKNG